MKRDYFDYEKAMQALLYVTSEIQNAGLHQSFKTLYFADQEYMRDFGRPILGDTYIKMEHGPAPSKVYDLIKMAKGVYSGPLLSSWGNKYAQNHLEVVGDWMLQPLVAPEMDYLAEDEKTALDHAIERCHYMSYKDRVDESHDEAWQEAVMDRPMVRWSS